MIFMMRMQRNNLDFTTLLPEYSAKRECKSGGLTNLPKANGLIAYLI
jgi:hypothetical protein